MLSGASRSDIRRSSGMCPSAMHTSRRAYRSCRAWWSSLSSVGLQRFDCLLTEITVSLYAQEFLQPFRGSVTPETVLLRSDPLLQGFDRVLADVTIDLYAQPALHSIDGLISEVSVDRHLFGVLVRFRFGIGRSGNGADLAVMPSFLTDHPAVPL